MNPVTHVNDVLYESSRRNMEAVVREPQRLKRMTILDMVSTMAIFVLVIVEDFVFVDGPVNIAIAALIGGYIGSTMLSRIKRSKAYAFGWLDGRRGQVHSLREALNRGMTPDEWTEAEIEKDISVMRWL